MKRLVYALKFVACATVLAACMVVVAWSRDDAPMEVEKHLSEKFSI